MTSNRQNCCSAKSVQPRDCSGFGYIRSRDSAVIKSAAATALFGQFDQKDVCTLEKSEALKIRQSTILYPGSLVPWDK